MENGDVSDPEIIEASQALHSQLALCSALSETVVAEFLAQKNWAARDGAVRMVTRLAGVSASAAVAMHRLKGIDINQTIVIEHIGEGAGGYPTIVKTNSGGSA